MTGPPIQCFSGELGELRFYPEYWQTAVRVSDREIALSLPVGCTIGACPIEFGQPLTIFDRNDMSTTADDVATVFKYAGPDPAANVKSPIFGMVASEAKQVLQPDGTLGAFLSYTEHTYDGRPFQLVTTGNETRQASFDGLPQLQQPTSAALHVTTATTYDSNCPGRVCNRHRPAWQGDHDLVGRNLHIRIVRDQCAEPDVADKILDAWTIRCSRKSRRARARTGSSHCKVTMERSRPRSMPTMR